MNADTLALAVMDDDGYGCAITSMPADNACERACARFERADAGWPAAREEAERILREAGEEYEAADAELARYETKRRIPLSEYRRTALYVVPPAGHYHDAAGYEDRLCACPSPLTYAPQPRYYDPREGE